MRENIERDYRENDLPMPDVIFGWEQPPRSSASRTPWPLERIMERFALRPEELLVVDDLKPGHDMARAAGVPFAAAGWANDIPEIEQFMRKKLRSLLQAGLRSGPAAGGKHEDRETGALQSSAPVFFVCQRSSRKYRMPRDWGG